jgi:uncharacterized YokU family protein
LICEWCEEGIVAESKDTVFWELPDGKLSIEINETPSIYCQSCGMNYQSEETVKAIEDQLYLIDTRNMEKKLSYGELMSKPRLLKRNYFDFSNN